MSWTHRPCRIDNESRLDALIERIAKVAELSRDGMALGITVSRGYHGEWYACRRGFKPIAHSELYDWRGAGCIWNDDAFTMWESYDWEPNEPFSPLELLAMESE